MMHKVKAAILNGTHELCIVLHSAYDDDQKQIFREERSNIKGLTIHCQLLEAFVPLK